MTSFGAGSGGGDPDGRSIGLTASYLTALAQEVGESTLTPAALARAVARVLPVDGAGLSTMVSVLRLPLGASNEVSHQAEVLQSTLGEGPCLDAAQQQAAIVADLDVIRGRWPLYARELTAQTPFRAVAAVPLVATGQGVFAALDVYSVDPLLSARLVPSEVESLAPTVAALLATCVAQIDDIDDPETGPGWYAAAAGPRHDVWVAVGMVVGAQALRTRDALSLLRARAYARGCSLDDLATSIVQGRIRLSDLAD